MIRTNKGETLTETLVALLIGVLALTMLPMAIVTAAKINNKVVHEPSLSTIENRTSQIEENDISVSIKIGSADPVLLNDVNIFRYDVFTVDGTSPEDRGYLFFEYAGNDESSD